MVKMVLGFVVLGLIIVGMVFYFTSLLVTLALILILLGFVGFIATFVVVYKPLNTAQLSMNPFGGTTTEHHKGLSAKAPWASLQKPEIVMNAEIVVTSGGVHVMSWENFMAGKMHEKIATRAYETKDSVLYGSWATAIRPRKGFLEQFVKKTPGTAALMVMAEIDITISDYVARELTEDVLANKRAIGTLIEGVFGGNNEEAGSPMEDSYGVIISNPKLFDLDLGERSKQAAEKLYESKKFRQAVNDMKTEQPDAEKATNAVLIATGMAKKNIYNIEGLEGAIKGVADAFFRR